MKSNNVTLGDILNSPNQYVIPVFQRYYRWDQPEWEKLWESLAGLQKPEKTGRHFLGFIVLVPEPPSPGKLTRYYLIDGQQRLTTLSLVLCALRDTAHAADLAELADEIAETCLIHRHKKGIDRFRLYPKQRDREHFVAAVQRQPQADGRIASAVRYFAGRLAAIPGAGTEDGLRTFFALLMQRVEFVHATLEGENAFNIFKSLNSTGVPLGQADLIRNFMFMHVPVEDQDQFDDDLWKPTERRFEDAEGNLDAERFSAFFRDNLMRDGDYVAIKDTFDAFQARYTATGFDPFALAGDLKTASDWYAIISGNEPDPSADVEAALVGLRELESSTTYSLLLNLYRRRQAGRIADADLATAIRLLSGFILRRLVCGENSRGYSHLFVQAIVELGDQPVDNLRRFLEARDFPDTPQFVESFVRFNLYGSRYRKTVLEALERSHGHKEPADLRNAQVEHIMPQTLTDAWRSSLGSEAVEIHATWLHTPGNLTLTGYNPELYNKPFAAKRLDYRASNYVLTRSLADSEYWGVTEIQRRGQEMAERAAGIWPGPAAPVRRPESRSVGNESDRLGLRRRYWTRLREYVAAMGSPLKLQEPRNSYDMRCGRIGAGARLQAYITLRDRWISAAVVFDGKQAKQDYQRIRGHREAIEAEIGAKLHWTNRSDGKSFEVVYRNPVDPSVETLWPAYFDWQRRALETLHRVFGSRIAKAAPAEPDGSPEDGLNVTERRHVEYWSALRERLAESLSPLKSRKPLPQSWADFSIGHYNFNLAATTNKTTGSIAVILVLHGPLAKTHFRALEADREAIEGELGQPLDWRECPDAKLSQVEFRRHGVDPADRSAWPDQHRWLQENLEAFYRVFAPRIKALKGEEVPVE
jgi:hypothetical protein